jgi:formylmethanofuran dehydrogenase subunit E
MVVTTNGSNLVVKNSRTTIANETIMRDRDNGLPQQRQSKTVEVQDKVKIRGYTFAQFVDMVQSFHGYAAPGVLVGGFMVDLAYQYIPQEGLYDIVCETRKCLPDAIQLLTPCTVGNGWLRIIDISRFAFTIYDKQQGNGIRVSINYSKLDNWPLIKSWMYGNSRDKNIDGPTLGKQIEDAGSSICDVYPTKVEIPTNVVKTNDHNICPYCGEPHAFVDGKTCIGDQLPYKIVGPRMNGSLSSKVNENVDTKLQTAQT